MDNDSLYALINSYPLKDCVAVLAICAPDILSLIEDDLHQRPDDPATLEMARAAVREALARENSVN